MKRNKKGGNPARLAARKHQHDRTQQRANRQVDKSPRKVLAKPAKKKRVKSPTAVANTVAASPQLIVTIPGQEPQVIAPDSVCQEFCEQLEQQCNDASANSTFTITALPEWPDGPRWSLLHLLKKLGSRVKVGIGDAVYENSFDAVLAAMCGPENLTAHTRSIQTAAEAAAIFHGEIPKVPAGRIHERLAELGGAALTVAELAKQIRGITGGDNRGSVGGLDAYVAAQMYIESLREAKGLDDPTQPVLVYHRSEFYEWSGNIWIPVEDDRLRAQVTAFLQNKGVPKITTTLIRDVLTNLVATALLPGWDLDLPFFIAAQDPLRLEQRPWFNCSNGIVDRDLALNGSRMALKPFNSRFVNTVLLPLYFVGNATCPNWMQFLNQVLPPANQQDRRQRALQEFFGYTMLFGCRFEKMLVLHGPPRSGKSTIMRIWSAMLGANNVADIPFDRLGEEHHLGFLRGKAANFSRDLDHVNRAREGLISQMISGEPITANRKFKSSLTFRLFAKLIVACNELPSFSDAASGIWRRLIIIPFDVVIPEDQVDTMLAETLQRELPGIFVWALQGLARLLEQQRFTNCHRCQAILGEHRTTSDSVAEFLGECCITDHGWDAHGQRLYEVYRFFCDRRGRKPVAAPEFGKRIIRSGHPSRRARPTEDVKRPNLYCAVRLTPSGRSWMEQYLHVEHVNWDLNLAVTNDDVGPNGQGGQGAVGANGSSPDGLTHGEAAT